MLEANARGISHGRSIPARRSSAPAKPVWSSLGRIVGRTGGAAAMAMYWKEITVNWGESDPFGLVYYPRIVAWFNDTEHELFRIIGYPIEQMIKNRPHDVRDGRDPLPFHRARGLRRSDRDDHHAGRGRRAHAALELQGQERGQR